MSTASAISPNSSAAAATGTNAFSSLDSEQFVKIIFTELSNQDPLQPSDSKALLEQLSSLRNIQSGIDLSTKMNSLVAQNEMASASGLIGKVVSGIGEDNRRATGTVTSVVRTSEGAILKLDNNSLIRMSNMDTLLDHTPAPTGATQ